MYKEKLILFLEQKGSKWKTLLNLNIPFCVAIGDLFGTMDWSIIMHSKEKDIVNKSGAGATKTWKWENSRDYRDIWMITLNQKEIVEFRQKYKDKFFRNKNDMNGTVYERRGQITFRIIYQERRRIRLEEKREREMKRIEQLDRKKEKKKKKKKKKTKKKVKTKK